MTSYQSWSVVFGEQPSAAKWNILGTNDAEFNSMIQGNGTGFNLIDDNGNEVIKGVQTASAVNELTVTNAATGNAPELSATGGDTNINLTLTPKGTGVVTASGNSVQYTIYATSTPSGNSDSTGSWADWGASTTITVPTWANRAIVISSIQNYYIVTSATLATTRVVIGSDTGATSGQIGSDTASANDERCHTWMNQITLTGTGSVTLKNQVVEITGGGAVRVGTGSKFDWVITFYKV